MKRRYMEWLAKEIGFQTMDDWYRITTSDFTKHHGQSLLDLYDGSPSRVVKSIFPEHSWRSWRFSRVPQNLQLTDDELREMINDIAKHLHIKDMDEWYRVSMNQIELLVNRSVINNHGGLPHLLSRVYPDYQWRSPESFFRRSSKSTQRWLKVIVEQILPNRGTSSPPSSSSSSI